MALYLVVLACYDSLGEGFANTVGAVTAQVKTEVIDFSNNYKTLTMCIFASALVICGVFMPNLWRVVTRAKTNLYQLLPNLTLTTSSAEPGYFGGLG